MKLHSFQKSCKIFVRQRSKTKKSPTAGRILSTSYCQRFPVFLLYFYNVLQPDTFFHQNKSNKALHDICKLYSNKNIHHIQICKMSQQIRNRYTYTTYKHAVKEKGNYRLPSGTQGKISGMQKGILRHKHGCHHNKIFREFPGLGIGIVKLWKQRCDARHQPAL